MLIVMYIVYQEVGCANRLTYIVPETSDGGMTCSEGSGACLCAELSGWDSVNLELVTLNPEFSGN